MTDNKDVRSHCNSCGGIKNHRRIYNYKKSDCEDVGHGCSVDWWDKYELLECLGCESVSLRHQSYCSEDFGPDGEPNIESNYYPPCEFRKKPEWFNELIGGAGSRSARRQIYHLLKEVYTCLHNDATMVAAMGIRSIIEHAIIDAVGDKGSFSNNLEKITADGHISPKQKEDIKTALEVGHATTHRSYRPTTDVLIYVLDIAELLINQLYIIPERSKDMIEMVPPRKGKSQMVK